VYTPLVSAHGMSDIARENRRNSSLLQIEGTGWDVGNAVLYLVSDMARYVTGQCLIVDGGVTLKGPERGT
ncbi:MAG: SDR family oxidoreductase, partial [bacterium]